MAILDAEIKRRALTATTVLQRLANVRAVYVFGSHAEGRADKWSDIDLAVFMDGIETWDIRHRARVMTQVQKEAGLDIEAHLFPSAVLECPEQGGFAAHILKNGVQIAVALSDE